MSQCSLSCAPRRGFFVALLLASVVVSGGLFFLDHTSTRMLREGSMEESLAVMRTRLTFLESQYQGRQQDVIGIQARVDGGCDSAPPVSSVTVPNTTYSPELMALLKNISGNKASDGLLSPDKPESIKAPFSLRIMPHLMEHPDSLRPAYQLKSSRQFVDYIIGVPHVRRDKETYLYETITYLLDKMSDEDKNYTMIVVMVGETNLTYVVETAYTIEKKFPLAVNAGLIEVISPSPHYYPDLDALPQTLGDSSKRVKWRTKQNLDAVYLMAYSYSRCLYYLMIEDDVLALDKYMTEIRKFTASTSVTNPDWFFIQYSTTGGIGKLFRSTDLIHFLTYVQLFYNNMPIDWLTESYLADRSCGINKGAKECAEAKTKIRPTFKTNLFKHIGLYSSLKGKLQKVKVSDGFKEVAITTVAQKISFQGPPQLPLIYMRKDLKPPKTYLSAWSRKWLSPVLVKYFERMVSSTNLSSTPDWVKLAVEKSRRFEGADSKNRYTEYFPHDNPPIKRIKCTLTQHTDHSVERLYIGRSFFWGKTPKKDDVIEFWFETPAKYDRYLVRSGNINHVNDIISKAVFEVLPTKSANNGTFVAIDEFDEFGMIEGQVDSKYGELLAMRIRFLDKTKFWVLINEIEFVPLGSSSER